MDRPHYFSTNRDQPRRAQGKPGHWIKGRKWLRYNQVIRKPCAIS